MILIIQYFSCNLVCRRKIVSKHSDARQQWMIDSNQTKTKMNDHSIGGKINIYICIYIYIYILQESFTICYHGYGLLKRFSDIFQSYPAINQQRVTCLHGVSMYFLFTVTNFKVVVCHFVQAKVTAISGLSFSTISSTFLQNKYPSTVRLNKSIFLRY